MPFLVAPETSPLCMQLSYVHRLPLSSIRCGLDRLLLPHSWVPGWGTTRQFGWRQTCHATCFVIAGGGIAGALLLRGGTSGNAGSLVKDPLLLVFLIHDEDPSLPVIVRGWDILSQVGDGIDV
ncbi:uncharacterized protein ARMOST_03225 [Armillaria ostoyae]|uniref:Uncharacterized protein n=1 Tax=Armillaria ostoyae TaxID=47428 RepID=A0A284QTV3_ARMOS|nr:uncharacterized protein ARMOST_03225 [Armillaria ostoyae]